MSFHWTRVHYMLLYGTIGAFLPYMPLYLNQRGLADWQIGWVLGLFGVAVMIMPGVMTHLADRRLGNRGLIVRGMTVAAGGLLLLSLAGSFPAVLAASAVFYIGFTPLISLTDGLTFAAMQRLRDAGHPAPPYHRVRIFGSMGFMLPAALLFFLLRYTAATGQTAILTAAALAATAALIARKLPGSEPAQPAGGATTAPSARAWGTLLRPPVLGFVGPLFLLFMAVAMFYAFYPRYLQELGIAEEWAGLIVNIGVAAEIGLMLFSGRLLVGLGVKGVIALGAAAMILRLGLLTAVPTIPVALGTQLLHAPIVLCLYLVPPMYLNAKAAPAFRNSIKGLYGVLCFGLARLLGSVVGGYAAELGLRHAFGLGAGLAVVAAAWLVLGFEDKPACADVRRQHAEPFDSTVPEPEA
jgi:PPP family 3-phenylpropionic acid transporter